MSNGRILVYEFGTQPFFEFPDFKGLDKSVAPGEHYVLNLTYGESDDKSGLRDALKHTINRTMVHIPLSYGVGGFFNSVAAVRQHLEEADERIESYAFRKVIVPWKVPEGETTGFVGAYYFIPALGILALTAGFSGGAIGLVVPIVPEVYRRRTIKRSKEFADAARGNPDFRFYSGIGIAVPQMPVETQVVPEAQDFIEELKLKEDDFHDINWNAANKRLKETYDAYLTETYKAA